MSHKDFYPVSDYIRIYFTPDNTGMGFMADIIEATSLTMENEWLDTQTIGKVVARFDGIRHLYLGEDGGGYIYCPNIKDWIKILHGLESLERKYCTGL